MGLRVLDTAGAERMRLLCEALVPGSAQTSAEVYVDALLAELPEDERWEALSDLEQVAAVARRGEIGSLAGTPPFERARLMAVEAYYCGYVARAAPGPGAWDRISFRFPQADAVHKDWSFMGIED